jgi:hypothetical protein
LAASAAVAAALALPTAAQFCSHLMGALCLFCMQQKWLNKAAELMHIATATADVYMLLLC